MEDDRLDLGLIDSIEATDIGEPGQRTFKITVSSPRGEAVVWMEKEQMFQIGLSIKQFVSIEDAPSSPNPYQEEYPAPPTPASAEFKASEMHIRHDPRTDIFTIEATDPESEYFVSYLPVEIRSDDIVGIVLTAMVLCVLSTLYPAWRAAGLHPSEVLAHE